VLALTEEGRAQAQKMKAAMCAACSQALCGISEQDLMEFAVLIARMADNLHCFGDETKCSDS